MHSVAFGDRYRLDMQSRPASTSALLLAEPSPDALARRPSAVVPLPPVSAVRRPSAVVTVNPAHVVASQQRFMIELMQERCSAIRASISGLSGRNPLGGGGGGRPKDPEAARVPKKRLSRFGDDALTAILSALYAKILVVLGFAFPVTEILSGDVPSGFYQGFYLYLYVGSIGFMCFMYASLLKDRAVNTIIRMHSAFPSGSEKDFNGEEPPVRRQSLTPVVRYGSFYLRLGAIAFGIGSMVYSGLEFGEYFELKENSACHNPLQALNPATRMVLTLIQMQFIFLNSKDMKMWRHKVVARFGLMHTIACNLCEWLYVLVAETDHEIAHLKAHAAGHGHGSGDGDHPPSRPLDVEDILNATAAARARRELPMEHCRRSNIIGLLVQDASPFLFPCTVEYSLICAVVLCEMWKNVSKHTSGDRLFAGDTTGASTPAASAPATRPSSSTGDEDMGNDSNDSKEGQTETSICPVDPHTQHLRAIYLQNHPYPSSHRSHHHFSVDCAGAHKGLFLGIVVMVVTIISIILFFVLNKDPEHHKVAVMQVNVVELVLYVLCTIAVLLCMLRMRGLKCRRKAGHGGNAKRGLSLDNSLLLIAQTGVYIYCMFSIIGCYFNSESDLGLVAEFFSLVQTTVQTVFVLDAWSRRCRSASQSRRKPGRQIVTFLLVANMSMWSINVLEKGHASFRPTHLLFYGDWAWTVITRVSMPLAIFYRFHSTICLFEIWKNAYKFKPQY